MRIGNKRFTMFCATFLLLGMSYIAVAQEKFGLGEPQASRTEGHPPDVGYGVIRGADGRERGLFYEKKHGLAIVEGDMIIGTVEELEGTQKKADPVAHGVAISGEIYRWPDGILPYQVDADLSQSIQQRITEAIEHWEAHTPIRFVQRTPSNQSTYPDYVLFVNEDTGCWAVVGKRGGEQKINLSEQCSTGNAIHEIGHTLGLFHEQSREDRDQFVRIVWENIAPEKEHNFEQHIIDADDIGSYDYGSIMHYPRDAFSKNGLPTIETLDPHAQIGQREGLSHGDIETILMLYKDDTGTSACSSFDHTFAGSLSGTQDVAFQPDGNYYYSDAGTHEGRLEGPSDADFDLYLYHWMGSDWVVVAESISATSAETISYSGSSGYYIWAIHSFEGSGRYTFCLDQP